MRGKLTEQLPEDGTAEELYRHLRKQKKDIENSGVLKGRRKKVILQLDDVDFPFPIPATWKWIRLECIAEIFGRIGFRGYTKNDIVEQGKGAISLSPSNITIDGKCVYDKCTYITWEKYEESPEIMVAEEDLIIVKTGSSYGKCGVVKALPEKATINPQLALLKYILCDRSYLHTVLISTMARKQYEEFVVGAATPTFSQEDLANFILPLPPLAEQKRIVERIEQAFSVLDTIDALQTQYADNLTVLKSKLIDSAIHGKLTEQLPKDGTAEELYQQIQAEKTRIIKERNGRVDKGIKAVDEDVPYLIPTHWKWIRFGDVGLFKKGPFGSALTKSMFVPKSTNAIKVYEQQHAIKKDPTLGTYYISEDYFRDRMKGFEVQSGDIIISCAGTIGETYVMPDGIEPGIINQALMRVTLASGINKKFFQHYFDSRLKSSAKAGNGSAIVNIPPFDVIKNWYFPLPPLAEQNRIVDRLTELLAVCDELKVRDNLKSFLS